MEIYPVPPQFFCDRLHRYDPDLQLNWDPVQGVWHIWHRNSLTGELSHVTAVVEPDGSYRPLDDRVFQVLERNRYFAEHPKELERLVVDSVIEEREQQQKFSHEEMRYLSKDRSLNRRFEEAREKAQKVRWEDWAAPLALSNGQVYVPTEDMKADPSKPTI